MLVLLYFLSQNPNFTDSVKPLMAKLKDSEQMLAFLNDLSKFTQTFSSFQSQAPNSATANNTDTGKGNTDKTKESTQKNPQSPTSGIADEYIERILSGYWKNR